MQINFLDPKRARRKTPRTSRRAGLSLAASWVLLPACLPGVCVYVDLTVQSVSERLLRKVETADRADCIIVPGALSWQPALRHAPEPAGPGPELYRAGVSNAPRLRRPRQDRLCRSGRYSRLPAGQRCAGGDIFLVHAGFVTFDTLYRARDVFLVSRPSWSPGCFTCGARSTSAAAWAWSPGRRIRPRVYPRAATTAAGVSSTLQGLPRLRRAPSEPAFSGKRSRLAAGARHRRLILSSELFDLVQQRRTGWRRPVSSFVITVLGTPDTWYLI